MNTRKHSSGANEASATNTIYPNERKNRSYKRIKDTTKLYPKKDGTK